MEFLFNRMQINMLHFPIVPSRQKWLKSDISDEFSISFCPEYMTETYILYERTEYFVFIRIAKG